MFPLKLVFPLNSDKGWNDLATQETSGVSNGPSPAVNGQGWQFSCEHSRKRITVSYMVSVFVNTSCF